jgi:acyl dehydratase
MSEKAKNALAIYKSVEGQEEGVGDWLEIDQDRINMFADATLDHQFIHIDPEKSAQLSPYKVREVTIEIEGGNKPVCVAESLIRYMYSD